ncbi:hypothetical protein SVIO_033580 [Streptomyces violaceusniger]|uniref:Uncharacterized protein n=1 Tax=Streptomyces violaceusniger TaxID=68280 RepID=A0A4D4KUW8_STRVO|nr:hypothetical protein SVIO_033580 [Streptomyces violaceusniger]
MLVVDGPSGGGRALRLPRLVRGRVGAAARGGRAHPPVALGAGRGLGDRAGHAAGHRLVDPRREVGAPLQPLVVQHGGQPARVPLADGAHLPGALPAVELQGGHRGLRVQIGDRVAGDLGAVEAGDGDERRGHGAEPGRAADARRQREQHGDPVDVLGHRVEVHGEPVGGRRLFGHLYPGQLGRGGMRDPFGAVHRAPLIAECRPGHDRIARRDPDLQTGLGQRMVLPSDQLGRHGCVPLVVFRCVRVPLCAVGVSGDAVVR